MTSALHREELRPLREALIAAARRDADAVVAAATAQAEEVLTAATQAAERRIASARAEGVSIRALARAAGLSPTRVHQLVTDADCEMLEAQLGQLRAAGWPCPR